MVSENVLCENKHRDQTCQPTHACPGKWIRALWKHCWLFCQCYVSVLISSYSHPLDIIAVWDSDKRTRITLNPANIRARILYLPAVPRWFGPTSLLQKINQKQIKRMISLLGWLIRHKAGGKISGPWATGFGHWAEGTFPCFEVVKHKKQETKQVGTKQQQKLLKYVRNQLNCDLGHQQIALLCKHKIQQNGQQSCQPLWRHQVRL